MLPKHISLVAIAMFAVLAVVVVPSASAVDYCYSYNAINNYYSEHDCVGADTTSSGGVAVCRYSEVYSNDGGAYYHNYDGTCVLVGGGEGVALCRERYIHDNYGQDTWSSSSCTVRFP